MQAAAWLFSAYDRILMLLLYARFDWCSIVGAIMYPRNINSKFTKQNVPYTVADKECNFISVNFKPFKILIFKGF